MTSDEHDSRTRYMIYGAAILGVVLLAAAALQVGAVRLGGEYQGTVGGDGERPPVDELNAYCKSEFSDSWTAAYYDNFPDPDVVVCVNKETGEEKPVETPPEWQGEY